MTWSLMALWLILIIFGAVSALDPVWLQELSRPGIEVESRSYKDDGNALLRQKNYRGAIANYRRALEIKPGYAAALVNMAIAYGQAGDLQQGIGLLEDALANEQFRPAVISLNLAQLLEQAGRTEEAARYYRQALGAELDDAYIHGKLGQFHLEAGRLAEAREECELALTLQQDLAEPYIRMLKSSLPTLTDEPECLAAAEKELAGGATDEDLAHRYDLNVIRRLQSIDRNIAQTHNQLGVIHGQLGDLDRAVTHFQASAKIWPGNETAVKNLDLLQQFRKDRQRRSHSAAAEGG